MSFLLFVILGLTLMLIGVPIFAAFALTSGLVATYYLGIPWNAIGQVMFAASAKYVLLAIPLFILAGHLMVEAGLAKRLVHFFIAWVGHWKGGLAVAMVLTMGFFGAISGSYLAALVAVGGIFIPEMERAGYPKAFAAALAASAAGLDLLIPPSNVAIFFSAITGEPVSRTFAAGMMPGIFQMVVLAVVSGFMMRRVPTLAAVSWGGRWRTSVKATTALVMPVLILGGIYTGRMLPSEAAAVACIYAVVAGVAHRSISMSAIWKAVKATAQQTAMIFAIIAAAGLLSLVLIYTSVPQAIIGFFITSGLGPQAFLGLVIVVCLILGLFMESVPIIFLTVSVSAPIAMKLGIPMVHLYVVQGVAITLGLLTPPVAMGLYTAASVSGESIAEVARHLYPWLFLTLVGCLLVYWWFPWLSTWLPSLVR